MLQSIGPQPTKTTEIKKATQIAVEVLNIFSEIETENSLAEQTRLLAQALAQLNEARTLVHAEWRSLNNARQM